MCRSRFRRPARRIPTIPRPRPQPTNACGWRHRGPGIPTFVPIPGEACMGATGVDRWLYPTDRGLYCEPGGFFVDPARAVDRAIITHGHSDHARPGHGAVLATPETIEIMKVRLGPEGARQLRAAGAAAKRATSTASACASRPPATSSARPRSCSNGRASARSSPATTSAPPTRPARPSSSSPATSSSPRRRSRCPCSATSRARARSRACSPPSPASPSARTWSASTVSANASA